MPICEPNMYRYFVISLTVFLNFKTNSNFVLESNRIIFVDVRYSFAHLSLTVSLIAAVGLQGLLDGLHDGLQAERRTVAVIRWEASRSAAVVVIQRAVSQKVVALLAHLPHLEGLRVRQVGPAIGRGQQRSGLTACRWRTRRSEGGASMSSFWRLFLECDNVVKV